MLSLCYSRQLPRFCQNAHRVGRLRIEEKLDGVTEVGKAVPEGRVFLFRPGAPVQLAQFLFHIGNQGYILTGGFPFPVPGHDVQPALIAGQEKNGQEDAVFLDGGGQFLQGFGIEVFTRLIVILLVSSSLQLQKGLSESLSGRFELIKTHQWTYEELKRAFKYDLDRYLTYGGYPGAVVFESDFDRWYAYLKESIIEAVVGRDILLNHKVGNPALFRQAFEILCRYPAQEISYTKLLGQLQDKGNTDLVKYYIELYSGAFLVHPLEKYSTKSHLMRGSSPKILISCPALYTMHEGPKVLDDPEKRGRIFEAAVGGQLLQLPGNLYYWREKLDEVDFVYSYQGQIYAVEVKSGRRKLSRGLNAFMKKYPKALPIIITPDNYAAFSEYSRKFLDTVANQ